MALQKWVILGLFCIGLWGCGRTKPAEGKPPATPPAVAKSGADKESAAGPEGPLWDALAWLPVLKGKIEIAVFDYPTIHDHGYRCRGTRYGNGMVRLWESMHMVGLSTNSLRRIIYVNDAGYLGQEICLCQTTLSGDEVSQRLKGNGSVESTWHKARAWNVSADGECSTAYVDGWILKKLLANRDEQKIFERILKVHAGEEPSLRTMKGMAEVAAALPREVPIEAGFGDRAENPPPIPTGANAQWTDLAHSRSVAACWFDTEELARKAKEGIKAEYDKMLPSLRSGPGGAAVSAQVETRGNVVRISITGLDIPHKLISRTQFDLSLLASDLRRYWSRHGRYPTTAEGLAALANGVGPERSDDSYLRSFLGEVPLDVWGHPFLYRFPHPQRPTEFDLRSAGPDGKPDTVDDVFPENK